MKTRFLKLVAAFIERFAVAGAGLASWGPAFQPEVPEELL